MKYGFEMIDISEPNDLAHRKCTGGGRKIRDTQRPPVGSGEERQPQKKAGLRRPAALLFQPVGLGIGGAQVQGGYHHQGHAQQTRSKKTQEGKEVKPDRMAARCRRWRPASRAGSRSRNPAGIRMCIWRNRGQRFHRETATMSFRSTFTVPGRKRTPAPSMNSVP